MMNLETNDNVEEEQKPGLPLRLSAQDEAAGPWGFWPTIGFSAIIGIVFFLIQVIIIVAVTIAALFRDPKLDINQFADSLLTNGLLQIIVTCAVAPFTIGLTVLFAKIRKGITIKQYLGFHNPGWKEILKWCLVVVLFAGCFDILTLFIKRPVVTEFMVSMYTTAYFTPLLWFAFVIMAPLTEEIFFRGFLFEGIRNSKLGPAGAIVITSLAWSAMHTQYDAYGMGAVFLGGLLLGFARTKSNSIYPPIVMHALQNVIATIEVAIYLKIVPNGG
jgi:hypothetical protein